MRPARMCGCEGTANGGCHPPRQNRWTHSFAMDATAAVGRGAGPQTRTHARARTRVGNRNNKSKSTRKAAGANSSRAAGAPDVLRSVEVGGSAIKCCCADAHIRSLLPSPARAHTRTKFPDSGKNKRRPRIMVGISFLDFGWLLLNPLSWLPDTCHYVLEAPGGGLCSNPDHRSRPQHRAAQSAVLSSFDNYGPGLVYNDKRQATVAPRWPTKGPL